MKEEDRGGASVLLSKLWREADPESKEMGKAGK